MTTVTIEHPEYGRAERVVPYNTPGNRVWHKQEDGVQKYYHEGTGWREVREEPRDVTGECEVSMESKRNLKQLSTGFVIARLVHPNSELFEWHKTEAVVLPEDWFEKAMDHYRLDVQAFSYAYHRRMMNEWLNQYKQSVLLIKER